MSNDEIQNMANNIHKVATELLPNATLLTSEEFSQKLQKDNLMMCSKEFLSDSAELKSIVEPIDFSYLIVDSQGQCFIKK